MAGAQGTGHRGLPEADPSVIGGNVARQEHPETLAFKAGGGALVEHDVLEHTSAQSDGTQPPVISRARRQAATTAPARPL